MLHFAPLQRLGSSALICGTFFLMSNICHAADDAKATDSTNLLDKSLDDKPAEPVRHPDAVKAVDDDELTKSLTGQTEKPSADPGVKFKEAVEHMGESADRLHKLDPGAVTQEIQTRTLVSLDQLIEMVRKQQSQGSGSGKQKPGDPKQGQQRQQNQGQGQGSQPGQQSGGGSQGATSEQNTAPTAEAPDKHTEIASDRHEWGNLPPRTRDMIVSGQNEQLLPKYEKQIEDYYRALAELSKTTRENQ